MIDIDTEFNDGYPVLLDYQSRWFDETAPIAICEKSRRIGISWADAAKSVLHAAEGRGHVYYQSYNKEMTKNYIEDCAFWITKFNVVASAIAETLVSDEGKQVLQYEIKFDSGSTIKAITSNPRVLRSKGKPGERFILDEAAFCDDLDGLLKAAMPLIQWGGIVRIISTHNGANNPFNLLVKEIKEGKKDEDFVLHTVTLDDAVNDGLARRTYSILGKSWHPSEAKKWRDKTYNKYSNPQYNAEEYSCIPRDSGSSWLKWGDISDCEHADAGKPELFQKQTTYLGIDIAIRKDLWVAYIIERIGDVLWDREMIVRQGISFAEQYAITDRLVQTYNPSRIAPDQTSMGEAPTEEMKRRYGRYRVEGVLMTSANKLGLATALREAFEDKRLRIRKDDALRLDLHSVKATQGPTGAPRLDADRKATDGHGDRFWALALAVAAAKTTPIIYEYESLGCHTRAARQHGGIKHLPGGWG